MTNTLQQFLDMGGHGFYVWSAYGSVLFFLFAQWFFSWRKWRQFLKNRK